ncbi:MAG TPA: DUF58 domain-containing protein [Polyangiaceae bacterium]
MQLFPTRPTVHIAIAALGTVTLGMALRMPAVVAWGGAMIAGLALARAMTKFSIVRLRAAGLEMIWRAPRRVRRVSRNGEVELEVELRNRDIRAVRYVALRAIASSELAITIEPNEGIIAAGAAANLVMVVRTPRVGRYCIHGLALEVYGPPGLFEVPLAFANPIGIEVMPRSFAAFSSSARGGRARRAADAGAPDRHPGAGTELYELREHVSGDPFKRIAWKASARRGRLMVREFEREDRDVVWLVLDASVELLAGAIGHAPLDQGIDELAALALRHLSRGDQVGLAVAGVSPARWLTPARGAAHAMRIAELLVASTSTLDADRSDYDESEVGRKVLDHLRFIDASVVAGVRLDQLDSIQAFAEMQRGRAPFDLTAPWAAKPREQVLRRYLACYGISSPPRLEQDRNSERAMLVQALERTVADQPRPSLVYVWSPPPDEPSSVLAQGIQKVLRQGVRVRWISSRHEDAIEPGSDDLARVIADAVLTRMRIARERGERILSSMGARVGHGERRARP